MKRIVTILLIVAFGLFAQAHAVLTTRIEEVDIPEQVNIYEGMTEIEEYAFRCFDKHEERFKMDFITEPIKNSDDAVKKAVPFLREIYGDALDRNNGMLYEAYYNAEREVWLVVGIPQFNTEPGVIVLHGEFYCFIEGSTGRVVYIFATR